MRHAPVLAVVLALSLPAAAWAAGPEEFNGRISTLGAGLELGYKISKHVSVRGLINAYDYDYHTTSDNIAYRGKLKLGSVGAQVDYRFVEDSPFYLTAGLYANDNKIDATATPTTTTTIGGLPYTPAQIGTLTGNAKFKSSAPYLGLGWRWGVGHVDFNVEAGAYFQGKPTVTLTSNGTLANDPTYQSALNRERQDLQSDLDDLKTYPVVALGVGYKF